ncbi:hypothetical protein CEXT_613991 [Caerostris extrusa]|uniref:Uncharacterized protein n=1 Tax=Caerostris extrusa TaxID=172846 RepID=A0AAV4QY98_CAEEX|nr:hypothetical protein CEXT_613991 [Caerostris extrusa]
MQLLIATQGRWAPFHKSQRIDMVVGLFHLQRLITFLLISLEDGLPEPSPRKQAGVPGHAAGVSNSEAASESGLRFCPIEQVGDQQPEQRHSRKRGQAHRRFRFCLGDQDTLNKSFGMKS